MGAVRLGLRLGLLNVDVEEPHLSDLGAFSQSKRVHYVDAEVPDRALDLRMAEQDLNGGEISGLLVDDRRLGPPQRVRSGALPTQSNAGDPLIPIADPNSMLQALGAFQIASLLPALIVR